MEVFDFFFCLACFLPCTYKTQFLRPALGRTRPRAQIRCIMQLTRSNDKRGKIKKKRHETRGDILTSETKSLRQTFLLRCAHFS